MQQGGVQIPDGQLEGRIAIVTGSSRGIGKAIAIGLASEGVSVVIAARSEQERHLPGTIYATASEIEASGGRALPMRCDVKDEESVNAMVARTIEELGRVDILVNNAAVGTYTPLLDTSVKLWDLVIAVDLRGPFLCAKAVLPAMIQQGRGSIINISTHGADNIFSSTVSKDPLESPAIVGQPYGVAKAGLERLSKGLAAEMGRYNIAVNAVKPARPVLTEGFKLQRPNADWSLWATPEATVKAVLFLAKQDASGVTGTVTTDEELMRAHGL